jgi:hypothetical protein
MSILPLGLRRPGVDGIAGADPTQTRTRPVVLQTPAMLGQSIPIAKVKQTYAS